MDRWMALHARRVVARGTQVTCPGWPASPHHQSDVQNRFGALLARRLDNDEGNKTLSIHVGQDGRVTKITATCH